MQKEKIKTIFIKLVYLNNSKLVAAVLTTVYINIGIYIKLVEENEQEESIRRKN